VLISLVGLLLPLALMAQIKVSGVVIDESGGVLSGASIIQKVPREELSVT
jgi:hypothetical protein